MVEIVAAVLLLVGSVLALLAGIGLQRFDDVFARMHAATKPATLGLLCILVATGLTIADRSGVANLALVLVLQFLTAPVGAHMIGRSAYRTGELLSPLTQIDQLAEADDATGRAP